MPARRKVTVTAAEALSPTVRGLTLRCTDGQPLVFTAGQWVDLHVPVRGGTDKRAYSVASAPGGADPARFELAVTRVEDGIVSNVLHTLEPGAELEIDGPHGFFTREGLLDQPALFVGTGTGLCPLRSMLDEALAAPPPRPKLTLLFGCRSQADILWPGDLARYRDAGVDVQVTLSRPEPDWTGRSGYVQTHLAELAAGEPRPHVFICGLSRMVGEVRNVLKQQLGFDRRSLHSERYD